MLIVEGQNVIISQIRECLVDGRFEGLVCGGHRDQQRGNWVVGVDKIGFAAED